MARDKRAARQEAWDRRAQQDRQMGNIPEYESRSEREARINLSTMDQERLSRQEQRMADLVSATLDQVNAMYFGLRDAQGELRDRLRHLEWENYMERT